jgi:hypothetical protein
MTDNSGDAWLSLDEAAERLGVSRLRVREAIAAQAIAARRDNHGFWRVSLSDEAAVSMRRMGGTRVDPQQLVELLFDEIEELNGLMAERAVNEERMAALLVRQQSLMERAMALAEQPTEPDLDAARVIKLNERSQQLIEQTLAKLEGRDSELSRLTGLMDRALATVAGLDAEVTRQAELAQKQQTLLERTFTLAQQSLERAGAAEGGRGLFRRLRERMGGRTPGRTGQ